MFCFQLNWIIILYFQFYFVYIHLLGQVKSIEYRASKYTRRNPFYSVCSKSKNFSWFGTNSLGIVERKTIMNKSILRKVSCQCYSSYNLFTFLIINKLKAEELSISI